MAKLVNPETLEYVYTSGCTGSCNTTLEIDNGLTLPCKEWTNMESENLRVRMLTDNTLMQSGLVRMVDRSSLGNSLKIKKRGIDVGPIKTEASGASKINDCDIHFDPITMEDFEKTFYIVNTEKNVRMCVKKLIGTAWQDWVSDSYMDYQATMFEDTDLADLIIADIIDKYTRFLPKRIIMATFKNAGEDLHGDDGVLAKAYYASKGQYFNTWEYDFSSVVNDYPNQHIQAIVGGCEFDTAPDADGINSAQEYLIAFVDWLNELKENKTYLFDASVDLSTAKVIVASNIVTRKIDLKVIVNDGTLVDWGCDYSLLLPPTELQKAMMINDTPLLFQYEEITNQNFWQKFKLYLKEFKRYLHRNGYEDIAISDIRIAIDPELMLEFDDQWHNKLIECCNPTSDISDRIGLPVARFVPLNCMNDTGLFFMTIDRNILLFSDTTNQDGMIPNRGRMRIKDSNCDNKDGEVLIYGGAPPVGMDVEQWGAFATNIAGSFFVKQNKLDTTPPYKNTAQNLPCYDDNVRNACVVEAACTISCSTNVDAIYDATADETTLNVSVNASVTNDATLTYDLSYSLSDGTSGTSTSANFAITLPGDQTNSGVVLSVTGTVNASTADGGVCKGNVSYTTRLGEGDGSIECVQTASNNNTSNSITTQLFVKYDAFGSTVELDLTNVNLSLSQATDYPDIAVELESIFPGTTATVTGDGTDVDIIITDVPSYISNLFIESRASSNNAAFTRDC